MSRECTSESDIILNNEGDPQGDVAGSGAHRDGRQGLSEGPLEPSMKETGIKLPGLLRESVITGTFKYTNQQIIKSLSGLVFCS